MMKLPRITVRRAIVVALLLLLVAGLSAPYLDADRFERRIREALEASLGRKVEIEETRFNLFRGPGFSLRKVVIHEDPAFGVEPFAYVASIEARLRLASLLRGQLEFSSLRLVEPSVNLAKSDSGPWNFQPLVVLATQAELPEIHVRRGRLNLKFGDTKSAVYFTGADLDVEPPGAPGKEFGVRFDGQPARTDRAGSGLGRLTGRGRWRPSPETGASVELSIALDRGPLANLSTLLRGYDLGIHGDISGEAKLSGNLSALDIQGRIAIDDLHRWDTMPPYAKGGALPFHGRVDLLAHSLSLNTVSGDPSALPFAIRFRAADYLAHPRWAVTAELREAPLAPLVEIARHMGFDLAKPLEMEGSVDGVVGYDPNSGLRGILSVSEARVRGPDSPPVEFQQARVVLDKTRLRLAQALMRTEGGEEASLEVEYLPARSQFDLRLSARPLGIEALRSGAGPLLGMLPAPLPELLREGEWEGSLRYHREGDQPGIWAGEVRLSGVTVTLPILAEPLSDLSATLSMQGAAVTLRDLRARVGGAEVSGEYLYRPEARRPHQFVCRLAAIEGKELERLLMPALRRPGGLVSRALGLARAPIPAWLRDMHAQGRLEIGALSVRGIDIQEVHGLVFWDSVRLELGGLAGHLGEAALTGRLMADLRGPEPAYEIGGFVKALAWKGGTLEGDVLLRASGTGPALPASIRAEGDFNAEGLDLLPEQPPASASGCYDFAMERVRPRLRLRNLRTRAGSEVFTGEGETSDNGSLTVQLRGERSQVRLAGRVSPFELEVSPASLAAPR